MKSIDCNYFCFNIINLCYLICGVGLVVYGILLLGDTERILISRIIPVPSREPLLYYICLALLFLGLLVIILSTLGCWSTYADNYCLLSLYIFAVLLLVLGESVLGIITAICPQYLGLMLNSEQMVDMWQRNYGVPGKEQFTAAIDLVQIRMECCGIQNGNDFGTSWWRLRELAAPKLVVPLSCCVPNKEITSSFLDPVPLNSSLCQEMSPDKFRLARYTEGCLSMLEFWLSEERYTFVLAVGAKLSIQLLLLFTLILSCSKSNNHQKYTSSRSTSSSNNQKSVKGFR